MTMSNIDNTYDDDEDYIIEEVISEDGNLEGITEEEDEDEIVLEYDDAYFDRENTDPFLTTTTTTSPAEQKIATTPKSFGTNGMSSPSLETTCTTCGAGAGRTSASGNRASGAGLSELSKQLRIFQAKNDAQSVELNRMERQLRILADLQGISVVDMRRALEEACQNEAFGEMQHRVASLRAQLEAASLASKPSSAFSQKGEATSHQIANLELRVGELEEVEEAQQAKIRKLYEQLHAGTARATRLDATCSQQQSELEKLKEELAKEKAAKIKLQRRLVGAGATNQQEETLGSVPGADSPRTRRGGHGTGRGSFSEAQMKAAASGLSGQMQRKIASTGGAGAGAGAGAGGKGGRRASDGSLLSVPAAPLDEVAVEKIKAELQAKHDKVAQKLSEEILALQVQRQVERDNLRLLKQQLDGADEQHKLRSEQFKARFTVQQERIGDVEQQLLSLYTAFELLRDERAAEEESRKALRSNLKDADAEVARHVDAGDQQEQQNRRRTSSRGSGLLDAPGTTTVISSSSSSASPPATIVISSPISTPRSSRVLNRSGASPQSVPITAGSSSQQRVMQGVLLVRSKLRNWKKRQAVLNLVFTHYRWDFFGDVDGKGKMYGLQVGVSKVEKYLKYPFGFRVQVNPYDATAPIVYAAATNAEDYHKWMAALTRATIGEDRYDHDFHVTTPSTPTSPYRNSFSNTNFQSPRSPMSTIAVDSPHSVAQERSDLARALALSTQVV